MLSPSHRAALATIADTFFPPLPVPDGITGVDAKKYYETGAGSLPLLLVRESTRNCIVARVNNATYM